MGQILCRQREHVGVLLEVGSVGQGPTLRSYLKQMALQLKKARKRGAVGRRGDRNTVGGKSKGLQGAMWVNNEVTAEPK